MNHKFSQITYAQRAVIEHLSHGGLACAAIASRLGVHRSTVWRELKRGLFPALGRYTAQRGQLEHDAARRRAGLARRKLGSDLSSPDWRHVSCCLQAGWSPEQIAGRSKWLDKLQAFAPVERFRISHETIYKAIFDLPPGQPRAQFTGLLRQSLGGRRQRRGRKARFTGIQNITPISQRPSHVLERVEPGHWEGDIVKGAGGKSFVGTLVERSSRLTILLHLSSANSEEFAEAVIGRLKQLPPHMRRSLTYDRGTEMARHEHVAKKLKMPVYFCDAYSPWQRPTNENTNGLLRQYLRKGTDLSAHSAEDLLHLEVAFNARPRAVLDFATSREVFDRLAAQA
jgi:transposase, IS30 family